MYIPALPALLMTALAARPSIEPRDAAVAAVCTRTTVTNYAKTHEVVKTYTGTMTILHTETETVYSPTSGVPKATPSEKKVIWAIPARFPTTSATPTPTATDDVDCTVSITYGGTTTRTVTRLATATATSTKHKTVTVPVHIEIPPLPERLRPKTKTRKADV